ncbi:hypothetical protein G039_0331055 [Pseudomonas aeruginosa VRFPA01]|nr:hypothetical protein G039_0331055 [Pseudomonas aeruginosa VRFPA01]
MSKGSRPDDELRFRPQPGKPQQRGQPFVNQVLRQANKAGTGKPRKAGQQPGASSSTRPTPAPVAVLASNCVSNCYNAWRKMSNAT